MVYLRALVASHYTHRYGQFMLALALRIDLDLDLEALAVARARDRQIKLRFEDLPLALYHVPVHVFNLIFAAIASSNSKQPYVPNINTSLSFSYI